MSRRRRTWRPGPAPLSPYRALREYICVQLGFCGSVVDDEPRHIDMLIPSDGPVTSDDFANLVFEAEGAVLRAYREQLRAAFRRFMGADVVDASQLR